MRRLWVLSAATVAPPFWPSSHPSVFVLPLSFTPLILYPGSCSNTHSSASSVFSCLDFSELNDTFCCRIYMILQGRAVLMSQRLVQFRKKDKDILKRRLYYFIFALQWVASSLCTEAACYNDIAETAATSKQGLAAEWTGGCGFHAFYCYQTR